MVINEVTIIGAGTMGNGIAQIFAMNNFKVKLFDTSKQALQKAINTIEINLNRMSVKDIISESDVATSLSNIQISDSISESVKSADIIVEAATENYNLKLDIFGQIDALSQKNCILATNTSSISITKIASVTSRQEKVIGMHFMNPVPVMKLVEVIRGYNTSDEVCNTIMNLCNTLQKTPVEVNDYPGFVANRILMPMINEAINCLNEGVAGVQEIDAVMKLGMAHPLGPLALADFIGLDTCLSIMNILYSGFGNQKYAPCPLLINMVAAGKLGKKSGEGFYIYSQVSKDMKLSPKFKKQG